MNQRELIILAGGKGTRLAPLGTGLPKILSQVRGRPFLQYIMQYYQGQGVTRFIFSLGHASVAIIRELETNFSGIDATILVEPEPLDTGGAVKAALAVSETRHVFVANGDTYFQTGLDDLYRFHMVSQAECSLALTHLDAVDRYGRVLIDGTGRVTGFMEKSTGGGGLVNGGIYMLDKEAFGAHPHPAKFSLEKDYLQVLFGKARIFGLAMPGYFIDIGVPVDLQQAQQYMPPYEAGMDE